METVLEIVEQNEIALTPNVLELYKDPQVDQDREGIRDEIGALIEADDFLVVRSVEEFQEVLQWANKHRNVEVAVRGPGTSSGSYKKPPVQWQKQFSKNHFVLVRLEGEKFEGCSVDVNAGVAVVGPNLTIGEARKLVSELTEGKYEIGINVTVDSPSIGGTVYGAMAVSDKATNSLTELVGGNVLLPNGELYGVLFEDKDYFNGARFEADEVTLDQIISKFPHRRAPFGFGLDSVLKLHEAPDKRSKVFFPFSLRKGEAMVDLENRFLRAIHQFNVSVESMWSGQKETDFVNGVQVRAFEIMDRAALDMAREGIGWSPFEEGYTPEFAIMADFGSLSLTEDEAEDVLFENGLFLDDVSDGPVFFSDRDRNFDKIEHFRSKAPEAMRTITKCNPTWKAGSTDFGVGASNWELLEALGKELLAMRSLAIREGRAHAMYGHALERFGPHLRMATPDGELWQKRQIMMTGISEWIITEQLKGERALLGMEKPIKPAGEIADFYIAASHSVDGLVKKNASFFREIDPNGLRLSAQFERWARPKFSISS